MRCLPVIVLVFVAACVGADETAPPGTVTQVASVPASPNPVLPAGIPASYDEDVPGADLPEDEVVPPGMRVTHQLLTPTAAGDAVVIMFAKPGDDPFVQTLGFVVWRRTEGGTPPWRPVFGLTHSKREGLLAIQGITGDATGDGSADAVIFEVTGGVGNCGRWRVIDLAAGVQRWLRSLCDAQVDLGVDPPGLVLTEAVYEPGDSHCCPSATRVSILEYRPSDGFVKASEETVPF